MKINEVIKAAEKEIGYVEKKSNYCLDDKTKNAGSANWTKYGKYFGINPAAWCDMFVDWCFVQAFGREKAKELLHGFSAYTPTSAGYFKKHGQWFTTPHAGDVIFYKNSTRICHTGIVYKVDKYYVYTIEGNTSGNSGVVANGGGVFRKKYAVTYSKIAGYGRPRYDDAVMYQEPNSNLKRGSKGDGVKWLQEFLNIRGYGLDTDGKFGELTYNAVVSFQKLNGLEVDGIAGKNTRAALKNI